MIVIVVCATGPMFHWCRNAARSRHRAHRLTDTCMQVTAIRVGRQHLSCVSLQLCRPVRWQQIMHACLCRQTTSSMRLHCTGFIRLATRAGACLVGSKRNRIRLTMTAIRLQHKSKWAPKRRQDILPDFKRVPSIQHHTSTPTTISHAAH